MGESGSIIWPSQREPIWRLNWRLADAPDQEGIVVSGVYYRGREVLYKGSLPLVRVQYDGACGPFRLPLNYGYTRTTDYCPGRRVCIYSYSDAGFRALSIEAIFAGYTFPIDALGTSLSAHSFLLPRLKLWELEQRWVFWDDGEIFASILDHGFYHCSGDHQVHAYWRFDLDVEGYADNVFLEYNKYAGNTGWGPGWQPLPAETTRVHDWSVNRKWMVANRSTRRGYTIEPQVSAGPANAFSNRDIWAVRYHAAEDRNGNQGSAYADDLQTFVDGESLDGQDVVVWYCHHHKPNQFTSYYGGANLNALGAWT